jgi:hypothetical protein
MSYYLGFEPTDQSDFFFVSYNNEDAGRVAPLTCEMAKIGIPLWYDYGIEYGRKWAAQINEKLSAAQAMILFFTKGILSKEDSIGNSSESGFREGGSTSCTEALFHMDY